MRVVLVDDDADIRIFAGVALGDRHDVESFPGVDAAIAGADWGHTDAAIIDVMMPGRSGDELVNWLVDNHPHVRRIVCTAMGTDIQADRFHQAHDIVTKPFTLSTLGDSLA